MSSSFFGCIIVGGSFASWRLTKTWICDKIILMANGDDVECSFYSVDNQMVIMFFISNVLLIYSVEAQAFFVSCSFVHNGFQFGTTSLW